MTSNEERAKVVIIYGGQSVEHEVSCRSASFIFEHIDRQRFEPIGVGVDHQGNWWPQAFPETFVPPRQLGITKNTRKGLAQGVQSLGPKQMLWYLCGIDLDIESSDLVFFPIIHGTNGEDGRLQGLFDLADVAYVGADTLSSAVSMDKAVSKQLVAKHDILVTPSHSFSSHDWEWNSDKIIGNAIEEFAWPLFVKPASLGSSVGISKVNSRMELQKACENALNFDDKVLIEKAMEGIREIECAVLGSFQMECASPGEVIPQGGFYSYDAKYVDDKAAIVQVPADLSEKEAYTAKDLAIKVASALGIYGMARIDFFLESKTGKYFFNEANTIPGFTEISQYPRLWQNEGIEGGELVQKLIGLAQERTSRKNRIQRAYQGQT
ncbi:MAG: D-alanine--D-alanine ligase family protein [Oligoflexales bacterium]